MPNHVVLVVLGLCLLAGVALAARRLVIVLLTLRARALTPTLLRMLSRRVRTRYYSDAQFFRADGAPRRYRAWEAKNCQDASEASNPWLAGPTACAGRISGAPGQV